MRGKYKVWYYALVEGHGGIAIGCCLIALSMAIINPTKWGWLNGVVILLNLGALYINYLRAKSTIARVTIGKIHDKEEGCLNHAVLYYHETFLACNHDHIAKSPTIIQTIATCIEQHEKRLTYSKGKDTFAENYVKKMTALGKKVVQARIRGYSRKASLK